MTVRRLAAITTVIVALGLLWAGLWRGRDAVDDASKASAAPPLDPLAPTAPRAVTPRAPRAPPVVSTQDAAELPSQPTEAPSPSQAEESPEETIGWLEDMALVLVSAVDPEVRPEDLHSECSDDGRRCVVRGPLETLGGQSDLMDSIQLAIAEGTLAPADVADLAHSNLRSHAWTDGGPGFVLDLGLDPLPPPDEAHGLGDPLGE